MCMYVTDYLDSKPRPGQLSNHPSLSSAYQIAGAVDALISHFSLMLSIEMYQQFYDSVRLK